MPRAARTAEARATRALEAAHRELARARRALAAATRPERHGAVRSAAWAAPRAQLDATMTRRRRDGVVGWSLGIDGASGRRVLCAVIYVSNADVELPARLRLGDAWIATRTEVVGALVRHVLAGASVGPEANQRKGTIGCFARAGGAAVALTAMHVTGLDAIGAGYPMRAPSRFDGPNGARIGVATAGTRVGVDIARIDLDDPAAATNALPGIGAVAGWRRVIDPDDHGTMVRMYGAATGFQSGHIVDPCAQFPTEQLADAIVVSIDSEEGDSGAAIVDDQRLVLGFLVGQYTGGAGNLRVFSPAGPALHAVGADIP